MKYTQEMFDEDFKDTHTLTFDNFDYEYFVALENIPLWDGDWSNDKLFLAKNAKNGKSVWINMCNVQNSVRENEIFIGGIYRSKFRFSVSVCRSTGCFTLPVKKKLKRNILVAREVNRIIFKRERLLYDWYESELENINKQIKKAYQEMDDNFCYLNLPENKIENRYKFKATNKNIKTKYGIEKSAYENDFELDCSPFNSKIYKDYNSLIIFRNKKEFKNAAFPLYEINYCGITYLFEKSDFELIKNYNEPFEIEYINQWEERVIELHKYAKKIRRWLNKCLHNIKVDVCKKYNYPIMKY